jgi:hypothetical protein
MYLANVKHVVTKWLLVVSNDHGGNSGYFRDQTPSESKKPVSRPAFLAHPTFATST